MKKPISAIYNETELAIFCRQAHFTFDEYHQSADGTVCALDKSSGQLFVGQELRKNCVHPLESILSVTVDEDGGFCVTFVDSQTIRVSLERAASEALVAVLKEYLPEQKEEDILESAGKAEAVNPDPDEDNQPQEEDRMLTDILSILANTGRNEAVSYLVSSTSLSFDEASRYVDNLEAQDESGCEKPYPVEKPILKEGGEMSRSSILAVVKELKPGDRIHIEYKPLIGKLRTLEVEYRNLTVIVDDQRFFSLYGMADDFKTLMEGVSSDLFDYIRINVISLGDGSNFCCKLKNVRILTKKLF